MLTLPLKTWGHHKDEKMMTISLRLEHEGVELKGIVCRTLCFGCAAAIKTSIFDAHQLAAEADRAIEEALAKATARSAGNPRNGRPT